MEITIGHNYDIEQFCDWAEDMYFVPLWGEPDYYEDGSEAGDEWIEWWSDDICRTEEAAQILVNANSIDEGIKTKVGSQYDIYSWKDYIGKLRSEGPIVAVFDMVEKPDPENPESGKTVLVPNDPLGRPLAITFGTGDRLVAHIKEQGLVPVLEEPVYDEDC